MQGGAFFRPGDLVAHIDRDGVSPIGFDSWSREGSVDEESTFVHPIRSNDSSSDVKIVSRPASCKKVQLLSDLLQWIGAYQ